jgi:hypothetical protein
MSADGHDCPLCGRRFPSRDDLHRHACAVLPGEDAARRDRSIKPFLYPYLMLAAVTFFTCYLLIAKYITGHWDPAPNDWAAYGAELVLYSMLVFCWYRYSPFEGRIYRAVMTTVALFVWLSFWPSAWS